MLQILQGCFPRSEDLRIFSMLRLQYVLLVFYETHKKTKKVCQNAHLLFFTHKAPTFTSWGFVIT